MRRSGGVSKKNLMKKLKSKVYVSFLISLYITYLWQFGLAKNFGTYVTKAVDRRLKTFLPRGFENMFSKSLLCELFCGKGISFKNPKVHLCQTIHILPKFCGG